MRTVRFRSAGVNLALVVTAAGVASAQPAAASLEDLKSLESATRVTVVDMQLRRFRGTIADASESLLLLRIGSEIRRFEAAEIHGTMVIFNAASRSQRPLRVVPMTGGGRQGIGVMIRF